MTLGELLFGVFLSVLALFLFSPTVVGMVDLAWMFYTGHQITGVHWTDARIVYATLAPVLAFCIALGA